MSPPPTRERAPCTRGPGAPGLAGSSGPASAGVLGAVHAPARGDRAFSEGRGPTLARGGGKDLPRGEGRRSAAGRPQRLHFSRARSAPGRFPLTGFTSGSLRAGAGPGSRSSPHPAGAARRAPHPALLPTERGRKPLLASPTAPTPAAPGTAGRAGGAVTRRPSHLPGVSPDSPRYPFYPPTPAPGGRGGERLPPGTYARRRPGQPPHPRGAALRPLHRAPGPAVGRAALTLWASLRPRSPRRRPPTSVPRLLPRTLWRRKTDFYPWSSASSSKARAGEEPQVMRRGLCLARCPSVQGLGK